MGINLLAAHALRFKVQARGSRLLAGLAVIGLGVALTWMVVAGRYGQGRGRGHGAVGLVHAVVGDQVGPGRPVGRGRSYGLAKLESSRQLERWALAIFQAVLGARWCGCSRRGPTRRWAIRRCAFCGN